MRRLGVLASILALGIMLEAAQPASACPVCDTESGVRVRAVLFGRNFAAHAGASLLPFPIFLGIAALLHFGVVPTRAKAAGIGSSAGNASAGPAADGRANRWPLIAAGTVLGIGMGGFVDGIVLHQILQLHNMLSAKYPKVGVELSTAIQNIEINMFWDGVFHTFTWLMTALGIGLLWRAVRREDMPQSTATLIGSLSVGWGVFNLVEGLINHQLLGIHHVVEAGSHMTWDSMFLTSGLVLITAGALVIRRGNTRGT